MGNLLPRCASTAEIEVKLLIEALYLKHGYDFHQYEYRSIYRRLMELCRKLGLSSIAQLQHGVLHDDFLLEELLSQIVVNVAELFRDPDFYKNLRTELAARFNRLEQIKVWIAGCATGEEAYSIAILLSKLELLEKSQIYASDINQSALKQGMQGKVAEALWQQYQTNYQLAGGCKALSEYFDHDQEHRVFKAPLLNKILFVDHNLTIDKGFIEADLIMCRNVMIYFDGQLQQKVCRLFYDSLACSGLIALGAQEQLTLVCKSDLFNVVNVDVPLYAKAGGVG